MGAHFLLLMCSYVLRCCLSFHLRVLCDTYLKIYAYDLRTYIVTFVCVSLREDPSVRTLDQHLKCEIFKKVKHVHITEKKHTNIEKFVYKACLCVYEEENHKISF